MKSFNSIVQSLMRNSNFIILQVLNEDIWQFFMRTFGFPVAQKNILFLGMTFCII